MEPVAAGQIWKPLIVCPHRELSSRVRAALIDLGIATATHLADYPRMGSLNGLAAQGECNICFLDVASNPEHAMLLIVEAAPSMPVVALNTRKDADLILRCLHRGAGEFLAEPTTDQLRTALERLARLRSPAVAVKPSSIYCVMPGKPGCGASTLATHLAIEFKRGGSAGLAGKVEAVTPATSGSGGTIKVLGVTVTLDARTRIEDKSPAKVDLFRINDINAGDYVRIRGTETAALALTATRLERDTAPSSGESFVRGTVRDVVRPSFTVLGVKVDSDTSTQFRFSAPSGTSAADAFFASGAGSVVSARGIATNGTIAATRVEQADRED